MGSARQQGPSPLSGPPLSWPAPGAGGSSREPSSVVVGFRVVVGAEVENWGRGRSWSCGGTVLKGVRAGAGPCRGTAQLEVPGVPTAPAAGQQALICFQEQHGPQRSEQTQEDSASVVREPAGLGRAAGFARAWDRALFSLLPGPRGMPPTPHPVPAHRCTLEAVTV